MKAMVLAAGLGTRLRPLTDTRPKALVEVAGRTLLEITLTRLHSFGVNEVIVNVHHFADMVIAYLKSHKNFGMRIEISREDDLLLDTGGGLKKASWFFLEDSFGTPASQPTANETRGAIPSLPLPVDASRGVRAMNPAKAPTHPKSDQMSDALGSFGEPPFLLHNVDVITNIDFRRMLQFHNEHSALATLAVQSRASSRLLLFNENLQLVGRAAPGAKATLALAFSGIHFISPRLLPMLTEEGPFSIIDAYLRLAAEGEKILAFAANQYYWRDLGRPADLSHAARDLQQGML